MNSLEKAEIALTMSKETIFESLMHEYGPKILNMVYLMIKDQKIAEDITQETFMKAYMNWDYFRGESEPKTWLYRIAINETKKYVRSWSFRTIFSKLTLQSQQQAQNKVTDDTESIFFKQNGAVELRKLVLSLSPDYQQVIILRYYQELEMKEIAFILQIKEEAVRKRLSRARQQIKQMLESRGETWM
ncbi:sigma-70 family RNA polymerase sigma factor [Brevibacillus halotolerans]|nr:sigma-70 family RNA polymerase sigma factor [Brevibacillus laterosporus]MCR8997867.1 sigma-70 family RNA polymerase sigma factor [Brevibacillus laterosporus]WPS86351.1 sigma-70 family RNA polymerase sigma factor [Brevibacillus halotolerans]